MIWKPNVTVAAVIEQAGKFLFVEEYAEGGVIRFSQPAGHLNEGESLVQAVSRETLEESAYHFTPRFLIGIYQWTRLLGDVTYLRFAFGGEITGFEADRVLDTGIIRALWLTPHELAECQQQHRSPLVSQCVTDYLAGKRYPLELIKHYG